uniref:Uncharacterized protein n=1 Tax=Aplanochytrium stocchinoi TaxID=215587 RepID=A0A7S3PPN1_9STRA|mmetsp:Transcript_5373/g.7005  ORF Transcript_5373/g.7005 Transcript_5373/m.7005 type:complete len:369 (+) Transcript_5373:248-1354(+)
MALEGCLELKPGPLCGFKGICVGGAVCVCDEGWSQSTEFALYLDEDPRAGNNSLSGLVCDTNNTILLILYGIGAFMSAVAFVFVASQIKKKSSLKRLAPHLTSYFLFFVYTIIRVTDIEKKIGQDSSSTFVWALMMFLSNVASLIFYNKYIAYQVASTRKFDFGHKSKIRVDLLVQVQNIVVLFDFVMLALVVASGYIESFKIDRTLWKTYMFIYSVRNMYCMFADIYYPSILIEDIKKLVEIAGSTLNGVTKDSRQNRMVTSLRNNLRPLKYISSITFSYNTTSVWFNLNALYWDMWLNAYKYYVPMMMILHAVMSIAMGILMSKSRFRSSKNSSNKSSNEDVAGSYSAKGGMSITFNSTIAQSTAS